MRKTLLGLLFLILLLGTIGCVNDKNEENEEKTNMKVIIDKKEYDVELENNKAATSFMDLLPLELDMMELNGNEKYYYLEETLPTNSGVPNKIQKGDIMLYGNNCIVVFYKSFTTSYSYTKIGHIHNLPDLGSGNIKIEFHK